MATMRSSTFCGSAVATGIGSGAEMAGVGTCVCAVGTAVGTEVEVGVAVTTTKTSLMTSTGTSTSFTTTFSMTTGVAGTGTSTTLSTTFWASTIFSITTGVACWLALLAGIARCTRRARLRTIRVQFLGKSKKPLPIESFVTILRAAVWIGWHSHVNGADRASAALFNGASVSSGLLFRSRLWVFRRTPGKFRWSFGTRLTEFTRQRHFSIADDSADLVPVVLTDAAGTTQCRSTRTIALRPSSLCKTQCCGAQGHSMPKTAHNKGQLTA